MAETVNLDDLAIEEVGTISQSTNSEGTLCLRVDLKSVDFNEVIDRLVGQYGYEDLINKIQEIYS